MTPGGLSLTPTGGEEFVAALKLATVSNTLDAQPITAIPGIEEPLIPPLPRLSTVIFNRHLDYPGAEPPKVVRKSGNKDFPHGTFITDENLENWYAIHNQVHEDLVETQVNIKVLREEGACFLNVRPAEPRDTAVFGKAEGADEAHETKDQQEAIENANDDDKGPELEQQPSVEPVKDLTVE